VSLLFKALVEVRLRQLPISSPEVAAVRARLDAFALAAAWLVRELSFMFTECVRGVQVNRL